VKYLSKREFVTGSLGLMASTRVARTQSIRPYELKVAGLYPEEQQLAISETIHNSAIKSAIRGDIKYDFYRGVPEWEFETILREISEQDYDLIIGSIFNHEELAREVALDFRSQSYLFGSYQPTPEFLTSFSIFENYTHDASYIAGIIASGLSETKVLGIFGTLYSQNSYRNLNAFTQGAKEVNSQINILVELIDGAIDPGIMAEKLEFQKTFGVDLIYAERVGVEKYSTENEILTIGNIHNHSKQYPDLVVSSTLWHFQPTLHAALNKLRNNDFKTENLRHHSGMKHGGCSLASLGSFINRVPPDVIEKAARRINEIKNENYEVATVELLPVTELGQ